MIRETITREYHVPQLGKVTARLYPFATETYKLLDHYGHIDRMRRIDQLGVIRNVYEGVHHSRWEYVMVQLGLIHQLSIIKDEETGVKVTSGLGLTSTNINILGESPSGSDILQMWVLLFNAGHLPGTFATERAILRYCQKHSDLRRTIYNGLPQQDHIKKYFRNILEKENIYAFHKILAYFHLERYRRYKSNIPNFINFLHEIINFYIFESEDHKEKQKNLQSLFQIIRKISYLFLDSQYGPVPVDFNLSTIFFNLQDYIPGLFKEHDNPLIRTLDSFEDLLSINMYHSADSIREIGAHAKRVEQIIEKNKDKKKLIKITSLQKYLIGDYKKEDYSDFQPVHKDWRDAINIHILFELSFPPFINVFKKYMSYETEVEWNKKYGTSSCSLTFQPSPTSKHMAITLSFLPKSQIQRNMDIIAKFLKNMINLNKNIKSNDIIKKYGFDNFIDDVFQRPYQELSLSILKYITDETLYFEFKKDDIIRLHMLSIRGSKNAAKKIKERYMDVDSSNSRFHEIKTLQRSLLNLSHRSELLLSLSQVLVYNEERKNLTDFDAFGLGFKNGKLRVLLVEAKDQRRGSRSDAKRQLEETVKKLNFKTSKIPHIEQVERGAYCYLTIDGITREGE